MRRWETMAALAATCALGLSAACTGEGGAMGGPPAVTDWGQSVPPACDPDGVAPCPDDWFVCVEDDSGDKLCQGQNPAAPDDGSWDCEVVGDDLVCTGDHVPADDGGLWDCVEAEDGSVTCTASSYIPSGGGEGEWDCWYEGEFVVCEQGDYGGEEGEPPPEGPPSVPDGGMDICFYNADDPEAPPLVHGYYDMESVAGRYAVHVRLVFNPGFVDNTYGVNSSDGYRGGPNGHRFADLVGSDHAEVGFLNGVGDRVLLAKFDYITGDHDAPSGYDCLGVTGGDGAVLEGSADDVVDATSSLDRNFNELGCVFTEDSPTPEECPSWEYRVIYEMWIAADAFGSSGFLRPDMTFVHASPSRTDDTIPVTPGDCP